MASFEGKVVAITGGASGIGLATAQLLSERGATVIIADIRESVLAEAAKTIHGKVSTRVLDVVDSSDVEAWMQEIVREHGRLDCAANIAGVSHYPKSNTINKIVDLTDEDFDFVMGVNIKGVFNCVRAELRVMKDGGSIINLASRAGMTGTPGLTPYCISKHGVVGLTRCAAREYADKDIRVNAIAPGPIDTPMIQAAEKLMQAAGRPRMSTPMGRLGKPIEVAKLIAFLLSEESSHITGDVHAIDGGMSA